MLLGTTSDVPGFSHPSNTFEAEIDDAVENMLAVMGRLDDYLKQSQDAAATCQAANDRQDLTRGLAGVQRR